MLHLFHYFPSLWESLICKAKVPVLTTGPVASIWCSPCCEPSSTSGQGTEAWLYAAAGQGHPRSYLVPKLGNSRSQDKPWSLPSCGFYSCFLSLTIPFTFKTHRPCLSTHGIMAPWNTGDGRRISQVVQIQKFRWQLMLSFGTWQKRNFWPHRSPGGLTLTL